MTGKCSAKDKRRHSKCGLHDRRVSCDGEPHLDPIDWRRDSIDVAVGTKPNIGREAVRDRQIPAVADFECGRVGAAKCWKCLNRHESSIAKFEHCRLQRSLRCLARTVQEINLYQVTGA